MWILTPAGTGGADRWTYKPKPRRLLKRKGGTLADYRDPKVTTGRTGGRRWIWIALAVIVVLLLLWWLFAGGDEPAATDANPDATVVEPVEPAPPADAD